MPYLELEKIISKEPKYRLKQIKKSLYQDLISNWDEALTLPKAMRAELNEKYPLQVKTKEIISKDRKTIKVAIKLADGFSIESVLLSHRDLRKTVCVSSQVGCSMGCDFCATGKMGFKRNLTVDEVINQVLYFARTLKKENQKITNIVFMGMGEPFLNYDNVLKAIRILHDPDGFNFGMRRFSISTSGIVPGIKRFSKENIEVNLAISLHAPNNILRSKLMPVSKKYPLEKVLMAVDEYIAATNRQVMFEYIMIDDLNDHLKEALELIKIMKKPLYLVNLIGCNPTGRYKPSPQIRIEKFKNTLEKRGVKVTTRYGFGQDIKAACGQLIKK